MFDSTKFNQHQAEITAKTAEIAQADAGIKRAQSDVAAGTLAESTLQTLHSARDSALGDAYMKGIEADTKGLDDEIKKAEKKTAEARDKAIGARAALKVLEAQHAAAVDALANLEHEELLDNHRQAHGQAVAAFDRLVTRHQAIQEELKDVLTEMASAGAVAHELSRRLTGRDGAHLFTANRAMQLTKLLEINAHSFVPHDASSVIPPHMRTRTDELRGQLHALGVDTDGGPLALKAANGRRVQPEPDGVLMVDAQKSIERVRWAGIQKPHASEPVNLPDPAPKAAQLPGGVTITTTRPGAGPVITQASVDQNGKDVGAVGLVSTEVR